MKTKYLLPAMIAAALGSGVAMAQSSSSDTQHDRSGWDSSSQQRDHWRDSRMNDDVGTGEGYTLEQLRAAGQGGSADENPQYMTQEELRDSPRSSINAGKISIGDGTAKP